MANNQTGNKINLFTLISFVLGVVVGPGFLWSHKDSVREDIRLENEQTQTMIDLSLQLNDIYGDILAISDSFVTVINNPGDSDADARRMENLNTKLTVLKELYESVESRLARIQNREPKAIRLDFVPPSAPVLW